MKGMKGMKGMKIATHGRGPKGFIFITVGQRPTVKECYIYLCCLFPRGAVQSFRNP
jgi:hypothetical protein